MTQMIILTISHFGLNSLDNLHLIVPYTLDCNDMRFATTQGFHTSYQFYNYLKDTFDTLYSEGDTAPKMMSIGLHCRLVVAQDVLSVYKNS